MDRTFDATFINTVINHPEVRPWMGGEGELDLSEAVGNVNNYMMVNSFGGIIMVRKFPGVYEAHSQFLPEAEHTVDMAKEVLRYMFLNTDCVRVETKVPLSNLAAVGLGRALGFATEFKRDNVALSPTAKDEVAFQALTLQRWAFRDMSLGFCGRKFHMWLDNEKKKVGSPLETHPDDMSHDQAAGACIEMCMLGNPHKGIVFYNQWAAFAGYALLQLLNATPVVVDIQDAVIGVREGGMEMLLCR